jgi:putative endopeptidase
MKKYSVLAASVALVLLAQPGASAQAAPAAKSGAAFGKWGVDLSTGDRSVRPGDSFFDYANGAWLKTAKIADDQQMTGITQDVIDRTQIQLRSVIEDSARNPTTGTAKKIGALYASFMDEDRIEQLGDAPLQRDLAEVKAIRTHSDMVRYMGTSGDGFHSSIFSLQVLPAVKGPKVYTMTLGMGGMGLPDRDYYLEERFKPQRDAYAAHIVRALKLANWPNSDAAAKAIMDFETKVAQLSWTGTEKRDPTKAFHTMALSELKTHASDFEWDTFLAASRAPAFDQIIVTQNTAVPKMAKLFKETPIETLQAWQALRMVNAAASYLPKRYVDNSLVIARDLSGMKELPPRWKRGVSLVNGSLGEAVGQEYVRRHFPASSKKMMEEMVANLQSAMRARIQSASWMTAETRGEALDKLDKQRVKVGYPNKWRDYTALQVDPTDLYGNMKRVSSFVDDYEMSRVGKPVDRDEWAMTPQTVNAYNNPFANEIVFPAAMLQPPYFDPKADAAVNYGAIGAVIGHEITHGFDDAGRKFDEAGNMRDWWKQADAARFMGEAEKLASQYDAYESLPGARVNGKLTLGENIGDQGGLRIALDAYRASLKGKPAPRIGGLTGDQRFFLSFAQSYRNKIRDEFMKMILVSDVHSPHRWRVDGTLRNIDEWYAAFGVKPGDKLYTRPQDRARVW